MGRRLSRSRRSTLLRSIARADTFLDTTQAAFTPDTSGRGVIVREKRAPCTRTDLILAKRAKSACESRYLFGILYTERRARPFRRLRRKRLRPEALEDRVRNPCVFARLRFLGCHVRFMRDIVNLNSKIANMSLCLRYCLICLSLFFILYSAIPIESPRYEPGL